MKQPKRIFFLCLFCLTVSITHAQDTTWQNLQKLPDDTVKVNRLLDHGKILRKTDPQKARLLYSDVLRISTALKYETGVARVSLNLGYISMNEGDFATSLRHYKTAMNLFKKLHNIQELCGARLDLATCFGAMGQTDSSFYYTSSTAKMLEGQPFLKELTRAYTNLGTEYNNLKSFTNAIYYQKKALELAKTIRDTTMMVNIYSGLSLAYQNQENQQAAYDIALAGLRLVTPKSNKPAACRLYNQYAYASIGVGKYDDAVEASKKALAIAEAMHDINAYDYN